MLPDGTRLIQETFRELGLLVLERGWLSSNNIVFAAHGNSPATVVDTGYVGHAEQTCALLRLALNGEGPQRVINTHLHSDHCGGNAALQRDFQSEVWVPEASLTAVQSWDQGRLSYRLTEQRCARFSAQRGLSAGETVRLGAFEWEVLAAPGHDADALMFYQRSASVLITADALWEHRLAISFPELQGKSGFNEASAVLDVIEALKPLCVIPGHGPAFGNVGAAIERSRRRIEGFRREPIRHLNYAARALTMFHLMEAGHCSREELAAWLMQVEVFQHAYHQNLIEVEANDYAEAVVQRLLDDGLVTLGEDLRISVS